MNKIIEEDTKQIIENINYEALKNSTVLITGASGMIGSYIVNTLITLNKIKNTNTKIIVLVRNKNKLSKEILCDNNIQVLEQDVINEININEKIDYIIHAASPASPTIMKEHPFETNIANTVGTYRTLELAIEKSVKSYLFVSSREIYGQPQKGQTIFTEEGILGNVDHLVPRNGYAEGKKAAENLCMCAKDEYGINTKIVRLAHTYGPGMSLTDGRVQADFLRNVINNEDIIMKSTGESIRTYTYISDAITAIFKILLDSKDVVYNVSTENGKTSIKQLAELLANLSNTKVIMDIKAGDANKKGTSSFTEGILSSSKIKNELHWETKYSLNEGFKRTIEYLKQIEKK